MKIERRLEIRFYGLMSLNLCCGCWIIGPEFGINNKNAVKWPIIHPSNHPPLGNSLCFVLFFSLLCLQPTEMALNSQYLDIGHRYSRYAYLHATMLPMGGKDGEQLVSKRFGQEQ